MDYRREMALWKNAALAVRELWASNELLATVREEYQSRTGCSEEAFSGERKQRDVIPFRQGYSFLLNKGLGMTTTKVADIIRAFHGDPAAARYASQAFTEQSQMVNVKYPQEPAVPYYLRVACAALNREGWERVPHDTLLETYAESVGITPEEILSTNRSRDIAELRAGFFYLAHKRLKIGSENGIINKYGFFQDRTTLHYDCGKVEDALAELDFNDGINAESIKPSISRGIEPLSSNLFMRRACAGGA